LFPPPVPLGDRPVINERFDSDSDDDERLSNPSSVHPDGNFVLGDRGCGRDGVGLRVRLSVKRRYGEGEGEGKGGVVVDAEVNGLTAEAG
jgi:hypothetical protein